MARMEEHKKVLEELAALISREEQCAAVIAPENTVWKEDLAKTKEKTGEKFVVLVMGIFSSGKSSMINALIGEELLPTGFLPETAVLGEMHYSTEKKVTLYPKKGEWEGGDTPFTLVNPSSEEIAKYASIDNEAGMNCKADDSDKIRSKFEKMVIHWPLEILKDGVVLVDSPGINDPYSNDYITRGYLPTADAIIYLMNSQQAYQKEDMKQLNEINGLGLRNIIFGYSFYDIVSSQPPAKVEQIRKVLIGHALKHGDLGEESVHFLSSLDGLRAKMQHDQKLLVQSGYDGLEKYLTKYLVENKGRDQIRVMSGAIAGYAAVMQKEAGTRNKAAEVDSGELERRIANARKQLEIAKMNAESTEKSFRLAMNGCYPQVKSKVEEYISGLADRVDLEDYEPEGELAKSFGKLNPVGARKKAKALQQECMEEYSIRMRKEMNRWLSRELSPYLISLEQQCMEGIQKDLVTVAEQLNDVDVILTDGTVKGGKSGTVSSAALGVCFGVLTGDWYTGAMSVAYGKGVLAKSVAIQAGIGVVTGTLLAMGVAVSLPAFIGAIILGDLISILSSNTEKQKTKSMKSVTENSRKEFAKATEDQRKNVDSIMKNVNAHLGKVCSDMSAALKADIEQKEALINATIGGISKEKDEKDLEIRRRNEAAEELQKIAAEAEQISRKYDVAI